MTAEDKRRIRERARAARQGLPPEERAALSHAACERLLKLPRTFDARIVLAYVASPEELNPLHAVIELEKRGARIVMPRITGPGMLSLHYCDAAQLDPTSQDATSTLEEGPFGIRQPCANSESIAPDQVDLVIVPGIAFDPCGRRVGYGGGYYDRLLPRMRQATLIGIAFDGQITDRVPEEPHDAPVSVVVTPSRTLRAT